MLQKLLIAFCTIFVLTACGGDDDSDQSKIVLNPPEDLIEEEEGEEEEEEEGGPWLSQQFDTDTSATWSFTCVSGCDATGTPTYNADDMTLDVMPVWGAAGDQLEISTSIDPEIADLTGGNAHLNLYVPSSYTSAGDVNAQVFFVNAADGKGYIGFTTVSAGWNTFSFEDIQAGEDGSFGFETDAFTLENITAIGVQIDPADGTSLVDVEGTLQIDDVIVSEEAISVEDKPSEPVILEPLATGDESFTFESDAQGWSNDSSTGSTVSHDADADALVITPDWENADEGGNRPKAMGVTTNVVSNATIRMIVTLTEAQVEGGIGVQPYIQQNSGSYEQAFGPTINTNLVAGDNAITYEAAELTDAMRIGVQLVGPIDGGESDVVLIKQVEIDLPDGGEPSNTQTVPVDAGWSNDGSPTTFSYDSGVVMTPDWDAGDEQKGFVAIDSPIDLTGATITYVVDVPEAYITDGGMVIQPFSQQNSGDYEGIFDGSISGGWNAASGLDAGENTIVHGPFTEPPADIQRIGLNLLKQSKADGVTGDVTIKSITITFPEE